MSNDTAGRATVDDGRTVGSYVPAFIRRSRPLHLAWQVVILLAGLAVVVLGVITLPLLGPGRVVVLLRVGVRAAESVRAQPALRGTRRTVAGAAQRAMGPRGRRRNLALTAVGPAARVGVGGWCFARYGLAVPWMADESRAGPGTGPAPGGVFGPPSGMR
ncbi:PGPGW domain-containing protein [Kitasatospora sp. NPDC001660]